MFYSSSSYRGCIVCLLLDCRFFAHLKASENTQIFAPFPREIRDGLAAMAALSTDDVLASVSEALGPVLWVSVVLCLSRNEKKRETDSLGYSGCLAGADPIADPHR